MRRGPGFRHSYAVAGFTWLWRSTRGRSRLRTAHGLDIYAVRLGLSIVCVTKDAERHGNQTLNKYSPAIPHADTFARG